MDRCGWLGVPCMAPSLSPSLQFTQPWANNGGSAGVRAGERVAFWGDGCRYSGIREPPTLSPSLHPAPYSVPGPRDSARA